jgi:hypothetical protein
MIYLRAEFHRHMCDDALNICVQPKSKGKLCTPDNFLIYILKKKNYKKLSQGSAVGNDWYTDWVVRNSDPGSEKLFLFYPKCSDWLRGASNV